MVFYIKKIINFINIFRTVQGRQWDSKIKFRPGKTAEEYKHTKNWKILAKCWKYLIRKFLCNYGEN